jgi:phage baseplate assembly protein V
MNRTSSQYHDPHATPPADTLRGLFMGRVIAVDPATYTAKVEVEDGSVTIQTTVMTLRAHDRRGWTWLPEEGELVVVAFLGGAKARPVILGSMFDRLDTVPNIEGGSVTLAHKSGTVLKIDADGDLHLTHLSGSDETIDADNHTITHHGTVAQFQSNGDVVVTHANGQKVTLSGTKVEADSANGQTRLTLDDAQATLESNGSSVEVDNAGAINIFPAGSAVVSLGSGGTQFAVRDGDFTGPPIGPLGSHTHQIIASGTKVIVGG